MLKDNRRRYTQVEAVPTGQVFQHPTRPNLFFPVHSRPQRRPDVDYSQTDCLCFVTFNVHAASEALLTKDNGQVAWTSLQQQLRQLECTVYAACMMPDHVHLLLAPSGTGETVSDIVARVKSCICLILRRERGCYLKWQASFYDHVLHNKERHQEEFDAIIHYIRSNPQKAELGDTYPYIL